jgi:competence protein ComEC
MGNKFIYFIPKKRRIKRSCILLIFVIFPFSVFCTDTDNRVLKIHFLNVAEGDSILIETPQNKTVLIDTGNLITGFHVVKYLQKNSIPKLDYLIFSHPHFDHIGGAFFVLQMVKVEKVYDNGQDLAQLVKSEDVYRWYSELVRKNNNYGTLSQGDSFRIDGVNFKILWPPKQQIAPDFNSNSLVIMIEYNNFRCLLTADLTITGEKDLLRKGYNLKADVLKISHHGENDANSLGFLERVSPGISVISVNENNIRGYPSWGVLDTLKYLKSSVYRTDVNGNIIVYIDDNGRITVRQKQ